LKRRKAMAYNSQNPPRKWLMSFVR
jgi:hypothetical protein